MAITSKRALARAAALGTAGALALGTLLGCSSGGSSGGGDEPSGTLHVLVSSAPGSDKAFKNLNADFEKKYPKVTVDFSSVPNASFAASRSSRLTAGNLDVTLGAPVEVPKWAHGKESDDALAADAGLFMDLTDEGFVKNFTPSVIDSLKYKGKLYTIPTGLSYSTGVFYNKKIFQENGLDVPTTWSEFQDVVSKLEAAGVTPFGIGGKDGWPAGLVMMGSVQSLYPTADDKVDLARGIWDGSIKLTDPKEVHVLEQTQYVYDHAQKNFAGVPYTEIPSEFANGQFAMTVDGTWDQTTIDAAVDGKFDYGVFPFPSSGNADDNKHLGGKVELRLLAAKSAPNKTAALADLDFFSQPKEYAKFVQTSGFAPAEPDVPVSDFLQSIEPYTSTFQPEWDTIWYINADAGAPAMLAFNYAGIAPLGTGTAKDAAAAAADAWSAAG